MNTNNGLIAGFILVCIFVNLKLSGAIDWNWIWITSPVWTPIACGLLVGGTRVLITSLLSLSPRWRERRRQRLEAERRMQRFKAWSGVDR